MIYFCCSISPLYLTLYDSLDGSTPGFPVPYHLLDFCSNSCSLIWWCPAISSSVIHFSSCPQSFLASGSFPMIQQMLAILSTTKNQIANIWIVTEKALATHSSALAWKNPMHGGAWPAVHGVAKSRTRLSDFTFTSHFHALEKEMATHSCVLAWRIPGTESLAGCRLWDRTESDTTDANSQKQEHWIVIFI